MKGKCLGGEGNKLVNTFFFFCILFVFEFLQFLQVRKIHHKFLHA